MNAAPRKCWWVVRRNADDNRGDFVFADTRNQARYLAMDLGDYADLRAYRRPALDGRPRIVTGREALGAGHGYECDACLMMIDSLEYVGGWTGSAPVCAHCACLWPDTDDQAARREAP